MWNLACLSDCMVCLFLIALMTAVGQGRSDGVYRVCIYIINITVLLLTSFLPHKKFTWTEFGGIYTLYTLPKSVQVNFLMG